MHCYVVDGRLRIVNPTAECCAVFRRVGHVITVDPFPVLIRAVTHFPAPWPLHAQRVIVLPKESTRQFIMYGDGDEAERISYALGYGGQTTIQVATLAAYRALKEHPRLAVMYPSRCVVADTWVQIGVLRFERYTRANYCDSEGVLHPADYSLPYYRAHSYVHLQRSALVTFYEDMLIGLWDGSGLPFDENAKRAMRLAKPSEKIAWSGDLFVVFANAGGMERLYYRWAEVPHWGLLPNAVQGLYFELHGRHALVRTVRGVRVASYPENGTVKYLQSTMDAQVTRAILAKTIEQLALGMVVLRTLDSGNLEVDLVECLHHYSYDYYVVKELVDSTICARTRMSTTLFYYEGVPYRLSYEGCDALSTDWVARRASAKVIGTADYLFKGEPYPELARMIRECDGYLEDFVLQQTDASIALLRRLSIVPMTEAERASYESYISVNVRQKAKSRASERFRESQWVPERTDNLLIAPHEPMLALQLKLCCVQNHEILALRLPSSLEAIYGQSSTLTTRWSVDTLRPPLREWPRARDAEQALLAQRIMDGPDRLCVVGGEGTGKLGALLLAVHQLQKEGSYSRVLLHLTHNTARKAMLAQRIREADCFIDVRGTPSPGYDMVICYQPRHARKSSYTYNCKRLIIISDSGLLTPMHLASEFARHRFPHCIALPSDNKTYVFELLVLMALEGALIETGHMPTNAQLKVTGSLSCYAPEMRCRHKTNERLVAEAQTKQRDASLPFCYSGKLPDVIPHSEFELSAPLFSIAAYYQLLMTCPPDPIIHTRIATNLDAHAASKCKSDADLLNSIYEVEGSWEYPFEYPRLASQALRLRMAQLCE